MKTKRLLAMILIFTMLLSLFPMEIFATEVTGLNGSGTETDPYKISSADELVFAAENMNLSDANYTGKYYKLTNDIDMGSIESFPMITSFKGVFNGGGYTIKNLTIYHTTGTTPYGIGFIHKNYGEVCDVTFDGADIKSDMDASANGNSAAAVVVAENCQDGVISCVTVKNSTVNAPKVPKAAAIAGMNSRAGNTTGTIIATVENCAVMNTTLIGGPRSAGNSYGLMMGGISGYSGSSIIKNCYVSGVTLQAASETTSPFHAGMICGYAAGGSIDGNVVASGKVERLAQEADQSFTKVLTGGICPSQNSYYGAQSPVKGNLIDTTNAPAGVSGYALTGTVATADELKLQATYEDLGWDFYSAWKMVDGVPELMLPEERSYLLLSGSGTEEDPYLINNADDLVHMAEMLNANDVRVVGKVFTLTADIDLSAVESFPMIKSFTGVFDGKGYTIKNLTIYHTTGTTPYGIGFIHKNYGKVFDVTFDGADIKSDMDASANGNSAAAVVVAENCQDGVISCVTVKNSTVNAPKVPKAAAIAGMNSRAGNTTGNVIATVENCAVIDTTLIGGPRTAGNSYGLMMGGISGYSGSSIIKNCYVSGVTLQAASETTSPFHAGMICGYAAGGSIDGNVVASGKVERLAQEADQSFTKVLTGGICPSQNSYYGAQSPVKGNLIDTTNAPAGASGYAVAGTATTTDKLKLLSTYQALGWDFYSVWKMENDVPVIMHPEERSYFKLSGAGTEEDPYLITNTEEFIYVAEQLNSEDGRLTGKAFALTADIDLTDVNFTPINSFSGIFDGGNHTIKNLTINDTNTSNMGSEYRVAFILINTGIVKNLVFESPSITTQALSTGGYSGAAVIVGDNAHGALISDCLVTDAVVNAPNLPKTGGIAVMNARTNNINATISRCVFDGTLVCGPRTGNYGPMMGGIAAYSATSTIEYCLANADITHKANDSIQSTVVNAGIICGYANSVTYRSNVAYGGSITIEGDVATQNLGKIYGKDAFGSQNMLKNIACEDIKINGAVVTDVQQNHGISMSSDSMIQQETYENLDWNFDLFWVMNEGTAYPDKYPVPGRVVYTNEKINMLTATISGDDAKSIGFNWYYLAGKTMNVVVSADKTFTEGVLTFPATAEDTCYKAEATGLDDNTTYYYRVEGDGQVSKVGTFTTTDSDSPFTFISVADTEADDFDEASIGASSMSYARMMSPDADFILHSGDFVNSSRGEEGWQDLLYQASDSLLAMPMVPTFGEEDTDGLSKHFNMGDNNTYYSFDYGNTHFIILDTNDSDTQCLSDAQIEWLKADVEANSDAQWTILSMHKGPYTSGKHANDTEIKALRNLFINELDELGIDLVIQGHDHIMGHTYDLKDDKATDTPVYTETINGKRFDYTVDPSGLVYMMSGGAGAEVGKQMSCDDLDEYIMKFARSDGRGVSQTFAAVTVEENRLSVANYEVKTGMDPTMIEGFGIDREIDVVEDLISNGNYTEARKAYNSLTSAQKDQIANYDKLVSAESDALSTDGGAWLDETSTQRRSIVVRNDTDLAFTHAPVLVKLENAPSEVMGFYTTDGEPLPYEIESYDKDGISTVWVKIPELAKESAATLWVYFGGKSTDSASENVWSDSYSLVEHFDAVDKDSTGNQSGRVKGELNSVNNNGDKGAEFDGSSNITYNSIGDDYMQMSVSAVVSLDSEDLTSMPEGAGIVSKYVAGDPSGKNAYLLGVNETGNLHTYYGCMWWRLNSARKKNYVTEALADGKQHMITVAYDGFTVETFVDGKSVAWETVMIESVAYPDANIPTVIGSYSPYLNDNLSGGFKGTIYDVQINGARTSTQWESFRYSNYFGDAVTVGKAETKGDFAVTVDAATRTATEAGNQKIIGVLSETATVTAKVDGKTVDCGVINAGRFEITVPVSGTGQKTIELTATANDNIVTTELKLPTVDTKAPKQPELNSESEKGNNTLSAQTVADNGDAVDVKFHINKSVALNDFNTKVAVGSTTSKTPEGVDPTSAEYSAMTDKALTTTVEDGSNPYQIYKVTLTDEQVANGAWRMCWQGQSSRQIHAYGYDFTTAKWVKITSSDGSGNLTMNIDITGIQYTDNNVLYMMIFRGMGQEISDLTSFIPEKGQYDFTMFWNSDTQYMSQFTEELVYHQHQWIADSYEDMNGVITFNTGDLANRSNLNYEYNWKVVDKSYEMFEERNIPYTFCWGNHDLEYDGQPNENRYYQTYFPTSRLSDNTGNWEISYAPDDVTGTTSRAMALKQTIQGSKLMILSLAYDSRLTDSDLTWAENVVKDHQDYTIIVITHTYSSDTAINNTKVRTRIVDKYDNIKLVLNGHLDGASTFKMSNGGFAVLQDYQGEYGEIKYGGNEFMRLIQFDVENDLIYFNTYSPLTGETISPYGEAKDPETEGLYQKNGDEFALAIDLNGDKTRTFTTSSLTMSTGETATGGTVSVTEGDKAVYEIDGLEADQEYVWYATVTDSSGNTTVTPSTTFVATASEPKNGIYEEDGGLYYYKDGARHYAGLIMIDGYYYYVNSSCKVIAGMSYYVSKTNLLLPSASYKFDETGKMISPPITEPDDEITEGTVKNGFIREDDVLYYYVDGAKTYGGLMKIGEDYYYVNSSCKVICGKKYYVSKTNNLLPRGSYTFDADGKMVE